MKRVSQEVVNFFNRLLDIPTIAPDERRRARLLNIILLGFTLISLVAMLVVWLGQITAYYTQREAIETYIPGLIIIAGILILYIINRYWSTRLASSLFLLLLTTVLYLFRPQKEMVWSNNALSLAIPVLMASLIMSPKASFVMAGIIGALFLAVSTTTDGQPNIIGTFSYFALAFVAWLSARRLERTVEDLRTINSELDRLVGQRTAELGQANEQLQQAYAELEERVQARTAELARTNERLQQEIRERYQIEQKLEQERNILRTLFDALPDAIYVKDVQSRFITCNARQAYLAGVDSPEDLIGKTDLDLFPEHGAAYYADEQTVIRTGQPILNREEPIGEKVGSQRWHLTSKVPLRDKEGTVIGIVGVGHDITERKQAEETLRTHSQILYSMGEGVAFVDVEGVIRYTNPSYEQMFGYSSGDLIGQHVSTLNAFPPEIHSRVVNEVRTALERGQMWEGELIGRKKDSTVIYTHVRISPYEYRGETWSVTVEENITERKEAERKLKASLQEKEVLLKEIHHRVKNNLQVISSLLDLQSTYVESEAVQEMFQESRMRVRSMALVHEQLYQSTDLARIDFANYVHDLTGYLLRAYGNVARNVTLTIDVASTTLSVETAVPLGLIISELVSNAYKHAFVDGRSGQIVIQLHQIKDHEMHLIVQDDGIGFPEDIDFRRSPSLGLTIIMTLVDQLRGQIELDRQTGSQFELIIPSDIVNGVAISN